MSTSFFITSVQAKENPNNIYEPILYAVQSNGNSIQGYAIPFETIPVAAVKIPNEDNLPVLRVFTCSGTFTLFNDFNDGKYYIFASHDQTGNTKNLWEGNNSTHNFCLNIDTTQQGLAEFSLTKLS